MVQMQLGKTESHGPANRVSNNACLYRTKVMKTRNQRWKHYR